MNNAVATQPAATPPTRELTAFEKFRNYVTTTSFLAEIGALVGGEAQAKTFVRVVLTAVQQTPALLDADRRSLLLACMKAGRDRLMPDGKEAVLNIYNTKTKVDGRDVWVPSVQYLPMVAGLIKKMYDSGHVTFVDAAAVYEADEFSWERGDSPRLMHRPSLKDDPGKVVAAYAVMKMANGQQKHEVIARRDIEKMREASKSPDGPGWKNWYDQFAIKSVIKRAYKQLPSSVELEQIVESDNEAIGFADFAHTEASASPLAAANVAAINAAVQAKAAPAIEHNPGQTIPQTIDSTGQRETVAATYETKAPASETKSATAKKDAGPTYAEVAERINAAKSIDDLDLVIDAIRSVDREQHKRDLNLLAADRRKELQKDYGK